MKHTSFGAAVAAFVIAGALVGCSPQEAETDTTPPAASTPAPATPAVATANPLGSVKVGDKAVCAVCAVGGHMSGPEEVKAVLDYKGKTYAFCNESEKAEFISNPVKYAQAQ